MRRNQPRPALEPPQLSGRRPRSPGTCGRWVPAPPARFAAAASLTAQREGFPARFPGSLLGRGGVRLAAPRAPRPQAAPRPPSPARRPCGQHLQGTTAPPQARFSGGPWLFRTRESGRCATQHRPENGRRRLGSGALARPRRRLGDAARPGGGRLDPQPAGRGARAPPRRGRGLGRAAGPGWARTTAARGP